VPFFAQRREQGKEKCRGAKASRKQLKTKVQGGEARQRRQHDRRQALASAGGGLHAENRRLAEALAAGEKKGR
jgi:hypothetical protein